MFTFFGLPAPPAYVGLDTNLFLAQVTLLSSGIADSSGFFSTQVAVPNDPALRGVAVALQTLGSLPASWSLSNPALAVLD